MEHMPIVSIRIRHLWDYWRHLCGAGQFPRRGDIDPARLGDVLPILFMIDIAPDVAASRFRLVGTEFAASYGQDFTGCRLGDVNRHVRRDDVLNDYRRAALGLPVRMRTQFVNDRGVNWRYERILLPLADDGSGQTTLLGAFDAEIPRHEAIKLPPQTMRSRRAVTTGAR